MLVKTVTCGLPSALIVVRWANGPDSISSRSSLGRLPMALSFRAPPVERDRSLTQFATAGRRLARRESSTARPAHVRFRDEAVVSTDAPKTAALDEEEHSRATHRRRLSLSSSLGFGR